MVEVWILKHQLNLLRGYQPIFFGNFEFELAVGQLGPPNHPVGQLLEGFQSSKPQNMGAENCNFLKLLKIMIEGCMQDTFARATH